MKKKMFSANWEFNVIINSITRNVTMAEWRFGVGGFGVLTSESKTPWQLSIIGFRILQIQNELEEIYLYMYWENKLHHI